MPTPEPHHDEIDVAHAGPTYAELTAADVDVMRLLGLPLDLGRAARRLATLARFAAVDADAELGLVRRHDGPPTT